MTRKSAYFWMNISVVLFGFTGIFGKLISLDASLLVCLRVIIALLFLGVLLLIRAQKMSRIKGKKDLTIVLIAGIFLTLHWLSFYYSIKVANITVALIGFSTAPLFTAFFEPFYFKNKLSRIDIFTSIVIIIGISIISLASGLPESMFIGLLLGFLAAATSTVFTVIDKDLVARYNGFTITVYQLIITGVILSISNWNRLAEIANISNNDWIYLILLSVFCTGVPHIISVNVMEHLDAFIVSVLTNLEPVYSILIAVFLFGASENMTLNFYIGSAFILCAIFVHPYLKKNYDGVLLK